MGIRTIFLFVITLSVCGPVQPQPSWKDYVIAPASAINAVRLQNHSTSGVTNPSGFLIGSKTRLTAPSSGLQFWPNGTKAYASGNNDQAGNIIDDNIATYWSSQYNPFAFPRVFPRNITILSPVAISVPGLSISTVNTNQPFSYKILTSTDNKTFTSRGTFNDPGSLTYQNTFTKSIPFDSTVTLKAVRIEIISDVSDELSIVEVRPYSTIPGPPFIDVDFGIIRAGNLKLSIAGASNPPPQLRLAFSETQEFLGFQSDFSYLPNQLTDDHVPAINGEKWTDTAGCQFSDGSVCAAGVRGFRFVRIYLQPSAGSVPHSSAGGWVDINWISLQFSAYLGTPSTYTGHFLSSDDLLNRIWYACTYTVELGKDIYHSYSINSADPNVHATNGQRVLLDGPKTRDAYKSSIWIESIVDLVSHGPGSASAKAILVDRALHPSPTGRIDSSTFRVKTYLADLTDIDYPAYWTLAVADYILYTGDSAFGQQVWPAVKRLFDYWYTDIVNFNRDDGAGELGYDYTEGDRDSYGYVTYYSAQYAVALRAAASIATFMNHTAEAASWTARANQTADNACYGGNFDPIVGAFVDRSGSPDSSPSDCYLRDSQTWIVLSKGCTQERGLSSLSYISAAMRTSFGNRFSDQCGGLVYPLTGYTEVLARFSLDDDLGAIDLIRREWGSQISAGTFTSPFSGPGTTPPNGGKQEMAAGQAAGAAPALTNYVLGVIPTSPGFSTFNVIPHIGNLAWANGAIPTPHGAITVSWTSSKTNFTLSVQSPTGTKGTFGVPSDGVVTLDGKKVWNGTAAVPGYNATLNGAHVLISSIGSGTHTIVRTPK